MVLVKLHKKEGRLLAAVCDDDLLGKRFEEGALQLDLTGDFYKGDPHPDDETGDIIRNADHVNLVGAKSVALGIHEGVIDNTHVKHVQGIPYAQAIVVHD
jgi:hypothetical protein